MASEFTAFFAFFAQGTLNLADFGRLSSTLLLISTLQGPRILHRYSTDCPASSAVAGFFSRACPETPWIFARLNDSLLSHPINASVLHEHML
jgi:hypothetical protein